MQKAADSLQPQSGEWRTPGLQEEGQRDERLGHSTVLHGDPPEHLEEWKHREILPGECTSLCLNAQCLQTCFEHQLLTQYLIHGSQPVIFIITSHQVQKGRSFIPLTHISWPSMCQIVFQVSERGKKGVDSGPFWGGLWHLEHVMRKVLGWIWKRDCCREDERRMIRKSSSWWGLT